MKFVTGLLLALSCVYAHAVEQYQPEETLHRMVKGYTNGDIGQFASCLWGPGDYNGSTFEAAIYGHDQLFNEILPTSRHLSFHDVVIPAQKTDTGHTLVTAWMNVHGRIKCGGPIDVTFNHLGYIERMRFACQKGDWKPEQKTVDGATAGQAADVGTTLIATSAGLVEANPIMAAVGLPVAAVVKLGLSKYAETLNVRDCHQLKDGLSMSGWGLAGWNLCMLATGGAGLPVCLGIGVGAAKVAQNKTSLGHKMVCRSKLPGTRFAMIDETGVYRTRPQ